MVIAPGSGSRGPGTVLCFWARQCSLTVTIKAHKSLYRLNSVRDYSPKNHMQRISRTRYHVYVLEFNGNW